MSRGDDAEEALQGQRRGGIQTPSREAVGEEASMGKGVHERLEDKW
jgi:hypothetical protein